MHPEEFLQDLRIGLRVLVKEKTFCALAVIVLALGICATATQFSAVRGIMLRGFAFPEAERLADVRLADPATFHTGSQLGRTMLSDYLELKPALTESFAALSAYLPGQSVNLTHRGQPTSRQGTHVTHDFFRTLGVGPALGRDFSAEDDQPGRELAVILSDALWRSEFSSDPAVLGRAIIVNGVSGTVIGVMAPGFTFPANEQLWLPLLATRRTTTRGGLDDVPVQVVARTREGVAFASAAREVSVVANRLAAAYPQTNRPYTLGVARPLITAFTGQVRGVLLTMLGFCLGVLLLACTNVMNMQLARATLRLKELAIRSALGATRGRLIRQMLTETLLVSGLGAVGGVLLASEATAFLDRTLHTIANPIPSWMVIEIDAVVLWFVVGLTLLAALVSGLVPALLSSRVRATDALKDSGRGGTSRSAGRIGRGLVVFQLMMSSLLLVGSVLQLVSIQRQRRVDFGFDAAGLLSARISLPEADYPTDAARRQFYQRLVRELDATPGIGVSALTSRRQMVIGGNTTVEIEGQAYLTERDRPLAQFDLVTPGFVGLVGQKLVAGRLLAEDDSDQREPIALVNATFARRHFGTDSGVGRRFRVTRRDGTSPGPWRRIVGVVTDVRMLSPGDSRGSNAGFYLPFWASPFGAVSPAPVAAKMATIVVRPPEPLAGETLRLILPAAVNRIDPNLPLFNVGTPQTSLEGMLGQLRTIAICFISVGAVAAVLAAAGLYGVMAFSISQRTQEFGIRMAVGASPRRVLAQVLWQGLQTVSLGLGLGLGLTYWAGATLRRGIEQVLAGVSPTDPLAYAGVALLLAAVSLLAVFIPARRATKVDPLAALRAE